MANKLQYINRVATALQGMDLKGLFPSVIIAQAALESRWGESSLAKTYNNHFGMKKGKGTNYGGWTGQTVTLPTREVINGQSVTVNSVFRVYPDLRSSILDHNGLFYTLSRYKAVCQAKTPREQITAIKNGGYATGTGYVDTVMQIIEQNNLTRFDPAPTGGSGSGSGSSSGGSTGTGTGSGSGSSSDSGSASGTGSVAGTTHSTSSQYTKEFKMNTKTLSIIIVAVGLALAAVGGYNLLF